MDKINEYDINTGEIYNCLYRQRLNDNKLYESNKTFEDIKESIKSILKEYNIITQRWEEMSEQLKVNYLQNEFRVRDEKVGKSSFLWHRGEFGIKDTQNPNAFDVVFYKSPCVINYDESSEWKRLRFYLFFALKISFFDITKMDDFLDYQLKKSFNNDKKKYFNFLDNVLMGQRKYIEEGKIEKVKKYLDSHLFWKNEKEKIKYYTWIGEDKSIKTMYKKLNEKGCIEEASTNIKSFLFVFSGKPSKTEKKTIKWLKSNRLLAYMLYELLRKKKIVNKDWQSVAEEGKCFINQKGKNITANDLAKAASDCKQFEVKPTDYEEIDSILNFQ